MAEHPNADSVSELNGLIRDYEATIAVTCDPEEKWRLCRILRELRACVIAVQDESRTA
jgi:hypothetical protein